MLSPIVVLGTLKEEIRPNVRFIEVERPHRDDNGKFIIDRFPISYWSRATNNYFMTMAPGTLVLIKGRLEVDCDIGIHIMTDYLETIIPATKK